MNMFKPTEAKTPDGYLGLIDEPRKTEIRKLHSLILKTVPNLKPFILVGMIGYGKFHFKYKSGREGEWSIIALASQKNYISLYVCSVKDGNYLPEVYKNKLSKANIGRSCIRFKKTEDIDLKIIEKILKEAEELGGFGQN